MTHQPVATWVAVRRGTNALVTLATNGFNQDGVSSMPNPLLSDRELVRLALEDQLSLILRDLWLRRTGFDPVNLSRAKLYYKLLPIKLAFALGMAFCGSLLTTGVVSIFPNVATDILIGLCLIFLYLGRYLIILWWNMPLAPYTLQALKSALSINDHLSNFKRWSWLTYKRMAKMDLTQLREAAKKILVSAASNHLQVQNEQPDESEEARVERHAWVGKLGQEFKEKYNTLKDLGLLTQKGLEGYKMFYDEAKQVTEEKIPQLTV